MVKQYSRDYLIGLAYKLNLKWKGLSREAYETRSLLNRLSRVIGKSKTEYNKFDEQLIKEAKEILKNKGADIYEYNKEKTIFRK